MVSVIGAVTYLVRDASFGLHQYVMIQQRNGHAESARKIRMSTAPGVWCSRLIDVRSSSKRSWDTALPLSDQVGRWASLDHAVKQRVPGARVDWFWSVNGRVSYLQRIAFQDRTHQHPTS